MVTELLLAASAAAITAMSARLTLEESQVVMVPNNLAMQDVAGPKELFLHCRHVKQLSIFSKGKLDQEMDM